MDFTKSLVKKEMLTKIAKFIDKDLIYSYKSSFDLGKFGKELVSKNFLKEYLYVNKNEDYLELNFSENGQNIFISGSELKTTDYKKDEFGKKVYEYNSYTKKNEEVIVDLGIFIG